MRTRAPPGYPVWRKYSLSDLLLTGEPDFVGVDDNHEVTRIHMRCVRRLVFAAQDGGDFRSETANYGILSIDNMPGTLDFSRLSTDRFEAINVHRDSGNIMRSAWGALRMFRLRQEDDIG